MNTSPKITAIISTLTIVLCLAACQPTPTMQSVVNKGDNKLIDIIKSSPTPASTLQAGETKNNEALSEKYQIPKKISKSFSSKDGKSSVIVDSDIVVPNMSAFPVLRIAPDDFTQDKADQFLNVFFQGKTLYVPRELKDYSKTEIVDLMTQLKLGKNSDLNEKDPQQYQESIASQVADLKKLLKSAPDKSQRRISDGKLTALPNKPNRLSLSVESELGKNQSAKLDIIENGSKSFKLRFQNLDLSYTFPTGKVSDSIDNISSLHISVADAKALADTLVSKLGLTDLSVSSIGTVPSGKDVNSLPSTAKYEDYPKCYVFYYTRCVNGVSTTYVNKNNPIDDQKSKSDQFSENWPNEVVTVYVDDTGILELDYTSPTKVLSVMNDNVALKPFSEIMQRFEEQMKIGGAWTIDPQVISRKVYIDKITLGLARIAQKDKANEYLLVPVWDFFGRCVQKYPESYQDSNLNENHEFVEQTFRHSYLTINAIDGSIIDRSLGY